MSTHDFDLDAEIRTWCRQVHPRGRRAAERLAELEDHLRCEIDGLLGKSLSERQAFEVAIARMGDPRILRQESERERATFGAALGALCTLNARRVGTLLSPKQRAAWQIGLALLFAGLMLLFSWLRIGGEDQDTVRNVLIAIWWVPFSILAAAEGTRGCRRDEGEPERSTSC